MTWDSCEEVGVGDGAAGTGAGVGIEDAVDGAAMGVGNVVGTGAEVEVGTGAGVGTGNGVDVDTISIGGSGSGVDVAGIVSLPDEQASPIPRTMIVSMPTTNLTFISSPLAARIGYSHKSPVQV